MIHITVAYPNSDGATFDHEYYAKTHLPMVIERVGSALKRVEADRSVGSGQPGAAPKWIAAGHLFVESLEEFQAAFGPHAAEIMGDIPNFTNVQPDMVFAESTAIG